jgi:type III secretion protein D
MLKHGTHTLGSEHDCDIAITDWTFPAMRLVVGSSGRVLASWSAQAGDASAVGSGSSPVPGSADPALGSRVLADFAPCAFGNIVVCVGPDDAEWPAERQLLEAAFPPNALRVAQWLNTCVRMRAKSIVAGVAVVASLAIGASSMMTAPRAAPPPPTAKAVLAQAQQVIKRAGATQLELRSEGTSIVVEGMVDTVEQSHAVRGALEGLRSPWPIALRFAVASEVAESIRTSVGLPGAEVRHQGNGVFSFSGEPADAQATRQAIERVTADLGALVRRVDTHFEQTQKKPPEVPILSAMQTGGVSVVQTRDGQKHLVVSDGASHSDDSVRQALGFPSLSEVPPIGGTRE